jgi:hypothetical protein
MARRASLAANSLAFIPLASIAWKRLAASPEAPSGLVLDGPNPLIEGEEDKFGRTAISRSTSAVRI